MRSITLFSEKGGVGKTTTALHLGLAFAEHGFRTLVVDTDPAGGIGASVGQGDHPGFWHLAAQQSALDSLVIRTAVPNLSLLAAGDVPPAEIEKLERPETVRRLLESLLSCSRPSTDLVLVDTPSGVRGATAGALAATEQALLLVQSEPLALRTASRAVESLAHLRSQGATASLLGVLLTMTALRVRESLDVLQETWSLFPRDLVLESHLPRDLQVLTAQAAGVPLGFLGARRSPLAHIFDQIALEIEARLGLEASDASSHARPFIV